MASDFTFNMEHLNLGTDAYVPSHSSYPLPPPSPTVIDKDGDLYLVVGSAKRAFQVDSHVLIRVSKVWKSMLTGGWAESRPEHGAWVVHWPANDPRAMEILLQIIHLDQSRVPQALNVDDLFRVAVAVDMYDLGRCLGLWPKVWCESVALTLSGRDFEDLAKLAWIGWVLGNTVLFENVLERMIVEVEVDGEGRPVDAAGTPLEEFEYLRAMDMIDHLTTARLQLVSDLLAVLVDALLGAAAKTNVPFCRSNQISSLRPDIARSKARADCNATIMGSLVEGLAAEDLFPLPAGPEDIFESAKALKTRLSKVAASIQTLGISSGGKQASAGHIDSAFHAGCNPKHKLMKQLDDIMSMGRSGGTTESTGYSLVHARAIGSHR